MHSRTWCHAMATALTLFTACTPTGRASTDSAATGGATSTVGTEDATTTLPDVADPRIGAKQKPPTDKVVPSAGHASSAGGARVTGGPERPPQEPRSSGCGGAYVNVTLKASALERTTLARVAAELLAPVGDVTGAASLSPAIRTFRVQLRDAAAADRAVARLRASPQVASAERDGCAVMIER